jgi:hypothetical protein
MKELRPRYRLGQKETRVAWIKDELTRIDRLLQEIEQAGDEKLIVSTVTVRLLVDIASGKKRPSLGRRRNKETSSKLKVIISELKEAIAALGKSASMSAITTVIKKKADETGKKPGYLEDLLKYPKRVEEGRKKPPASDHR